jgi:hypothetical protein
MSSPDHSVTRRGSTGKESISHVEDKDGFAYDDHITQHPNAWSKYRYFSAFFHMTCHVLINLKPGNFCGSQLLNF